MVAAGSRVTVAAGKSPQGRLQLRRGDELGEVVELLAVLALLIGVRPVVLGLGVGIRAEDHRVDRVDEPHHACLERRVAELPDTELEPADGYQSALDWSAELRGVQAEYGNLRSMLAWWLECGRPASAVRAGATLSAFWMWRGLYSEGSYWLEAFLELEPRSADDTVTPEMRAKAMHGAGLFASRQGNYVQARQRFEAAAGIWRAIEDRVSLAYALSWLGLMAWLTGDAAQATQMLEESRRKLEVADDAAHLAMTLRNLGMVARSQGEYARAVEFFRESVAQAQARGQRDMYGVARGLCHLARAEFLGGDTEQAGRHFREGLLVMRDAALAGHTLADCLDWLAAAEGDAGQPVIAARLFGAADEQWRASGAVRYAPERPAYEADLSRVRDQLDAKTFVAAWAEGTAMSAEQAIAYGLALLATKYAERAASRCRPTPL
jgi:tetratricopeptide (TPR) repeat protein